MFLLCLIRISQLVFERQKQLYGSPMEAFDSFQDKFAEFIQENDADIRSLREKLVFSNRPLGLFLHQNSDAFMKLYRDDRIFDF